jgi:hypothetical protein
MNVHHLHHEEDEDACISGFFGKIASVLANCGGLNRPNLRARVTGQTTPFWLGARSILNPHRDRFPAPALFQMFIHFFHFPLYFMLCDFLWFLFFSSTCKIHIKLKNASNYSQFFCKMILEMSSF